jgi:cephalosporin hydroxylase
MTYSINGVLVWQHRAEVEALAKIMREHNVKCVIEIGFKYGGTVLEWDRIIGSGGYIVSIEISPLPASYLKHIDEMLHNTFTFIQGDSAALKTEQAVDYLFRGAVVTNQEGVTSTVPGYGSADMLFIDGMHGGDYPLTDYNMYEHFVRPGGLIVMQDINHDNVRAHYAAICASTKYAHTEINIPDAAAQKDPTTGRPEWCGIGVLFKK